MVSRSIVLVILLICCSFYSNELYDACQSLQVNLNRSLYLLPTINAAKTKLEVTKTGFVRFTQTFKSGKQNYTSLNLNKFSAIHYWGTTQAGILVLTSIKNDVIVQTFHDPAGDVDSMANHLDIPLAIVEPEQLVTVQNQLRRVKALLAQKE